MKLDLVRIQHTPTVTIGELHVDGVFHCWTCEDTVRDGPKVYGQTAIPEGEYPVVVTYSNRFKVQMPLLQDVPGFQGIRIHPGNTAADTEGCILPGFDRLPTGVGRSRAAYEGLYAMISDALEQGEEIEITVRNHP